MCSLRILREGWTTIEKGDPAALVYDHRAEENDSMERVSLGVGTRRYINTEYSAVINNSSLLLAAS